MVVYVYNLSAGEIDGDGSLGLPGQLGLPKTSDPGLRNMSQETKQNKHKNREWDGRGRETVKKPYWENYIK